MAHLTMLVIFYVDVISCQNFNLPHIYHIFVKKPHFWDENSQINHMVSEHGSYYVKWHGSIYLQLTQKVKIIKKIWEYICVFEYISTLHSCPQIYSNLPLYKMKWNIIF
jgi:predicted phosphatase